MIPIAYKALLRNSLPSTTVDGRSIVKVLESFALNKYSNPIIGINFLNEWTEYYNSVDQYFTIVDDDRFSIAKYYSTRIRFTVVADDLAETNKSVTLTIEDGVLEYTIESLPSITSIVSTDSTTACHLNTTGTGVVFNTLPIEDTVTIVYNKMARGYIAAHSIMQQAIEWMELSFGDTFKPINGFIVDRGSIANISKLVGNDLLTVLSYDCVVACKHTMTKTVSNGFVPVSSIDLYVPCTITGTDE